MILASLLLVTNLQVPALDAFVSQVQAAVSAGSWTQLRPLLSAPQDAKGLEAMAPGAVLKQWKADVIVAPPGYERFGKHWMVFHRYQEIEADHDAVHPILEAPGGLRLGAEIAESISVPYRIEKYDFDVRFDRAAARASITTTLEVKQATTQQGSLLMRMNDAFVVTRATLNGVDVKIARTPTAGPTLVQSGGLLYVAGAGAGGKLVLSYGASLDVKGLDKTTASQLLLSSYWYPHIGRQPAASRTRVSGPSDWVYFANGDVEGEKVEADTKTAQFKNLVPLSWFHVCGGSYKMAAEVESRGRKIRTWHLAVNEQRGRRDAESARDAIAFFEDRFGPFPYNHYDVVDTPDFYGIECYSFTMLQPDITSWATTHEVGHTYFGGLVPNTYIGSIWNESITQYVDSIQLRNNADRSLQSGYATRNQPVALTDSFTPHGPFGNTGYYRGAFVMKMLENEIGIETMNRSLKQLVAERRGKVTEWGDVEQVFMKNAGDVGWFFDHWVRGRIFPTVAVARGLAEKISETRYNTSVILTQAGTDRPFKLKMTMVVELVDGEKRVPIKLEAASAHFDIETTSRPRRISFDPIGWTLASVPTAFRLVDGDNLAR